MIKTFKSPQDTGTVSPNEDLTHVNPKSISVAAKYKSARRRNKSVNLHAASPPQTNGRRQVVSPPGGPHARQGHIRSLLTTPLSSAIPSAIHTAVSDHYEKNRELASPSTSAAAGGADRYSDQAAQDKKLMQIAQSSRNKTLLHLAHERQHQSQSKPRWLGASRNHMTKKSTKYSENVGSLNKFSSRKVRPNFGTLNYS
jgi:hypothetical protein